MRSERAMGKKKKKSISRLAVGVGLEKIIKYDRGQFCRRCAQGRSPPSESGRPARNIEQCHSIEPRAGLPCGPGLPNGPHGGAALSLGAAGGRSLIGWRRGGAAVGTLLPRTAARCRAPGWPAWAAPPSLAKGSRVLSWSPPPSLVAGGSG